MILHDFIYYNTDIYTNIYVVYLLLTNKINANFSASFVLVARLGVQHYKYLCFKMRFFKRLSET